MKYPIGIQSFEKIIEDGFIYVDKTALIYKLTHEHLSGFPCRLQRIGLYTERCIGEKAQRLHH